MLNLTGMLTSRQTFAVYLKRKACLNDNQSARRRVEYVQAKDWREARDLALRNPKNSAFIADGQPKEVRLTHQ